MLRWTPFLYLAWHTSWYVRHVFCTWVGTLHVAKTVCRCQQRSPKVLALAGTIDSCWKACKKMLPGQSPMIMTYVKAWQRRYVHKNVDVCDISAKTVRKLK